MRNPFASLARHVDAKPTLRERLNETKAKARQVFAVNKVLLMPIPKPAAQTPCDRPMPDAKLIEAAAAIPRLDAAINAVLPDAYGHPDDLPGYTALNDARDAMLEVVIDTAALAMAGLRAKADVLLTRPVKEDDRTTRFIAQSLARDLVGGHRNMIEPAAIQAVPVVRSSPSPALAAMVSEWLETRQHFDRGSAPEDEEGADRLHRRWVDLQLAIYRFPAVTLADLQTKVPVFLDELRTLEADDESSCRDLPATAWRGVLADIERVSGFVPSKAMAAPIKSSSVMPEIDLKRLSLMDLRGLHEVAELIGGVGSAVLCQPRCLAEGRPQPAAASTFARWITEACETVQGHCEEEARGRVGTADRCDKERLCILADATVENGDPKEIRAFVRDLAESV